MLEIKDLSVRYGKQAPTIEHFNLNMKKGEIISVVGACFPYRTERSFISSINNAPSYLLLCFLDYICVHLF